MEGMTFRQVSDKADIARTTVYTRLKNIEVLNNELYNSYVFMDNNGTRRIRNEKVDEVIEIISSDNFPNNIEPSQTVQTENVVETDTEAIKTLTEQLEHERKRYDKLFERYTELVDQIQGNSDRLLQITENQQVIMREHKLLDNSDKVHQQEIKEKPKEVIEEQNNKSKKGFFSRLWGS
ncbi:hypothetical protein [Vagococcus lutrae]|uniref:hypothetical protein n=1 Tax=Vagococcus lutrae TaxID=81947 RepID=UPI00288CDFE8|nr:hypothetical protein [Vagococcus lutrae]MDT2806996.1 hypothetical protein [Vagococcus lutrae]MDT2826815.1 hypothetical protein [Vagococcus lutrae]MDT2842945.1 hypothetical protein [Vagococcus lutrae]